MEILAEIMRTVEKRDMLVSILEEQRLKERAEDKDLESLVLSRGYEFHWAQGSDTWGQEKLEWLLVVDDVEPTVWISSLHLPYFYGLNLDVA